MSVENFFPGHYPWQRILANSSLQIEELTVTENGVYSEDGKAYSPVVVNVSSTPMEYNIQYFKQNGQVYVENEAKFYVATEFDAENGKWLYSGSPVSSATPGTILTLPVDTTEVIYDIRIGNSASAFDEVSAVVPFDKWFVMPSYDIVANVDVSG